MSMIVDRLGSFGRDVVTCLLLLCQSSGGEKPANGALIAFAALGVPADSNRRGEHVAVQLGLHATKTCDSEKDEELSTYSLSMVCRQFLQLCAAATCRSKIFACLRTINLERMR